MSQNNIHPSAVISSKAELGSNITIGPFSVVGDNVKIDNNCHIHSHVVIEGNTEIGQNNKFFPFSAIGLIPQDLKFGGENSKLIIGNNNNFREHVTINPGTKHGGMITQIGNNCLLMVASHVAHDCKLGNNIIMANNATLAGHVEIDDFAIIGGLSAVHQFVKIGAHAMIGGMSAVQKDVLPFSVIMGERAKLAGINIIGMKRRNFTRKEIKSIQELYDFIFWNKNENENLTNLQDKINIAEQKYKGYDVVQNVIDFIKHDSNRAICGPKN